MRFSHESLGQRVVFAPGEAALAAAAEARELGAHRVMLIASAREPALVDSVAEVLPVVLRHDEVVMHVPVPVAERARAAAADAGADAIVTIGGGSATGLGKAVALTRGLPIVAVPTTYAGSEATNMWGMTEGESKITGVDARVLPRAIVYDATLLMSLPADLTVASGLNAMAHGVDSLWGPRADPIDAVFAGAAVRDLAAGLLAVVRSGPSADAIERTLYGAYLAAVAFTSAGSGLHHKICHVLGGMWGLPHAQTHAVVLPHVLAFNAPNAPEAEARIGEAFAPAFGTTSAASGLAALRDAVGAPRALRDFGMPERGIPEATGPILAAAPANNPTPLTDQNVTALLRAAWEGDPT